MAGKKREKEEERRRIEKKLCMLLLFALPFCAFGRVHKGSGGGRACRLCSPGRCASGCTHVIIWETCNPCQRTSQESFYTDSHLRVISTPHTALHIHDKVALRPVCRDRVTRISSCISKVHFRSRAQFRRGSMGPL